MDDLFKRVGKFYISDELIRENPEMAQKILSKVIVVRCESDFMSRSLEYIALSSRFEIAEEGIHPPLYTAYMKNGFVSFSRMI